MMDMIEEWCDWRRKTSKGIADVQSIGFENWEAPMLHDNSDKAHQVPKRGAKTCQAVQDN